MAVHLDLQVPASRCISGHRLHVQAEVVIVPNGLVAGRETALELGIWHVLDEGEEVLRNFLPMVEML